MRLGPDDRVLDLGCGPGMLAGAFAPLVREVVALDPEPEMLRIARAAFPAGNVEYRQGSSADLPGDFGRFRLVTMGRSFHWMDRAETLRRLDGMLVPGGAVVLFDAGDAKVPANTWQERYAAVLRSYSGADKDHPRHRAPEWVRHECILLESAFAAVEAVSVFEHHEVTAAQLIDRAFSKSGTAPERLGADADRLARDIEALVAEHAPRGRLREVVVSMRADRTAPGGGRWMSDDPPAWAARKLLRAMRSGTLATSAAGQPFASLVTPACAPDLGVLLLLSSLSEHTRHLRADPRCSVLVCGAAEAANPQTAPRVTVTGVAETVADQALKARFLAVHPYASLYADFGDFAVWRIRPMGGLYVGGFARAARLRAAELTPDAGAVAAIAAAEADIIAHCNADHPDALAAIAGMPGGWRMVDVRCRWLRPGAGGAGGAGALVRAGDRGRRCAAGADPAGAGGAREQAELVFRTPPPTPPTRGGAKESATSTAYLNAHGLDPAICEPAARRRVTRSDRAAHTRHFRRTAVSVIGLN